MPEKKKTYQQLKTELDEVLEWFDSGDIDIEEAVEKYEKANKLLKELEKLLSEAELSIKKLAKK